ncbi:MAG: hypothetical protein HY879_06300 [Deltaproteobacteria bacterium]|nr:hypothetical protein [Deltaproteobacteria bacterium]
MRNTLKQLSPRTILAGIFFASLLPFLLLELFSIRFHYVMDRSTYLLFHNIVEFFSIMVSLSVFGVGWYSYEQSRDRHALFLSAAFLSIGLLDFMHTLANAAMPAFITPNSSNKSTQFWIAARLFSASAFLASAFVSHRNPNRWLSKTTLMTGAMAISGMVFAGVIFFPSVMPATYIQGIGLTPFKRFSEYLVILLLLLAAWAYWSRMARTGDRQLIYYPAAFIVSIFSELVFASYKTVFDTYNVLGHVYKVAAFYLIYKGLFATSVKNPYVKLSAVNERLRAEIDQHRLAEEALRQREEQLCSLSSRLLTAQEEERKRISRELHDSLGSSLSAVKFGLGNTQNRLLQGSATSEDMEVLIATTQRSIDEVRRIMTDLRPSILDDLGLITTVGWFCRQFQSIYGNIHIEKDITVDEKDVADPLKIVIFRILQEALNNAAKYSQSEWVTLSFVKRDQTLDLVIDDSGAGFDLNALLAGDNHKRGLGLTSMKERTELSGGVFSIESTPGSGTRIRASWPIAH